MTPALVADTGGLLRAIRGDRAGRPEWPDFARELRSAAAVIVPGLVLAEIDWFLRGDRPSMRKLVGEIFDPKLRFEFEATTAGDVGRALQLDAKFAQLRLGLVDSTVAAVAERRRVYRVLTTDRRDFSAIRVGPSWGRALALVP